MLYRKMQYKLLVIGFLVMVSSAQAFCGFYVSQADADLFNDSSKVIIARDGNKTVLTMANDFAGPVTDFAMVVPVPTVMQEGQIQIADPAIIDRIDAYSAPRLVEYHDSNPCLRSEWDRRRLDFASPIQEKADNLGITQSAAALGVTIEASFDVGEYEILILSAEESTGLETWLNDTGYNIPEGASDVFNRYIAMGMKFFVAKVNIERFEESGNVFLRPLSMAMETDEFMLPIQLGTINSRGTQDLIVFLMSPEGRIETSNYPTVKIPSNMNLPEYVEDDFGSFYVDMLGHSYERMGEKSVFIEYAWDMAWCDPCAADPLTLDELRAAGVFWVGENSNVNAPNVYLTRLHLQYTKESHPEDLMFKVTTNRENLQGRYILQRPFRDELICDEAIDYIRQVQERQDVEAQTLANATGWDMTEIRSNIGGFSPEVNVPSWWEQFFNQSPTNLRRNALPFPAI